MSEQQMRLGRDGEEQRKPQWITSLAMQYRWAVDRWENEGGRVVPIQLSHCVPVANDAAVRPRDLTTPDGREGPTRHPYETDRS
jgi:hypothetical protein